MSDDRWPDDRKPLSPDSPLRQLLGKLKFGTPIATNVGMTMLGTEGRVCDTCRKGMKQGKAVSRYLGRWLCNQCARKAFGNKQRRLP